MEYTIEAQDDGALWFHSSNVYLTAHDAANADTIYTGEDYRIGQAYVSPNYWIYRVGLFFDTSVLPDNLVITSATLRINLFNSPNVSFVIRPISGAVLEEPLVVGDYGDLLPITEAIGDTYTVPVPQTGGYKDLALNAAGLALINKTGITKIALRSENDINSIPPSTDGVVSEYCDMASGLSDVPPLLVIAGTIARHHIPTHPTEPKHGLPLRRLG